MRRIKECSKGINKRIHRTARANMNAESVGTVWSDRAGKTVYGTAGSRDVLILVSEDDVSHPDVVRRRSAIELTEEARGKLENQGISRQHQQDDLSIVRARYALDSRYAVSEKGGKQLTRQDALKSIADCIKKSNSEGIVLYYIGDGKRNTGDWCFQDGFITFADLATLYMQLLRGRVLTIVSDCSHSGSWIRECMAFLDQQGVGPCGHKASNKGILMKVMTSCLSHETPKRLAHSAHALNNDKNTGDLTFTKLHPLISGQCKIATHQHARANDFTAVRCGQASIGQDCLCLPQATWRKWDARNRTQTFLRRDNNGERVWRILLLASSHETMTQYLETKVPTDYLELLSGSGEAPTKEDMEAALRDYQVYRMVD